MSLTKYSIYDVLKESNLFLMGHSLHEIAGITKIPLATVSYHLKCTLKDINKVRWLAIRSQLEAYAKDQSRVRQERKIRKETPECFSDTYYRAKLNFKHIPIYCCIGTLEECKECLKEYSEPDGIEVIEVICLHKDGTYDILNTIKDW